VYFNKTLLNRITNEIAKNVNKMDCSETEVAQYHFCPKITIFVDS